MTHRVFGGVLLLMVLCGGCSSAGSSEQTGNSPLAVETSQMSVTIRNTVGQPLTDVSIAIVPVGGLMEFATFFSRIESSEKREIVLSDFRGRDGTTFNLRVVKPRSVRLKAKDFTGKDYDAMIKWK
jgi:hypothetical protein